MDQSCESIATSEEYEILGCGEPEAELKLMDQANGNINNTNHSNQVNEIKTPCPLSDDVRNNKATSRNSDVETVKDRGNNCKMAERCNGREKQLKGELVTDHPLAFPVSPETSQTTKTGQNCFSNNVCEHAVEDGGQLSGLQSKSSSTLICAEHNQNVLVASTPSPVDETNVSRSPSLQFNSSDGTMFPSVKYLGCAAINAPRSEKEIQRNMAILNEQSQEQAIEVTLFVPSHSEGAVILYELDSTNEIASFLVHRILFCARGRPETREKECFAFACSHGNTAETAIFHCHVFKCDSPETVVKLLQCFAAAFRRVPKLPASRTNSIGSEKSLSMEISVKNNLQVYVYEATIDIKEEDSKGNYASCPREKDYFKLRSSLEKMVAITVNQVSSNKELIIQRCFGLLISPGRNLEHTDMHILEGVIMNKVINGDRTVYHISASWNPCEPPFEVLNTPTPRDNHVYLTIAADLVILGIEEPVRFIIETKAKIFSFGERFWYFTRKPLHEQFYLRLKEVEAENGKGQQYEVVSLDSSCQRKRPVSLNLNDFGRESSLSIGSQVDPETESDNDEPLLSGTGDVSKECSEVELEGWSEVLNKWRLNLKQRPKQLPALVRRGVPEALRGEAWQLLAGCTDDRLIVETYRNFISKDSSCGNVIQRDINRTFPAHEYFRESGGVGQDSLFKICKAYSVYDPEIGYCQGQSFLAAALLLHMPEEQAFSILVKIMFDYGLRDFFKNGFEELHLRLYQLERLMEDQLPELYAHFVDLGIEAHMFASQWFLTLFTAKFPLFVVFYILDIFLLDGLDILFQVAVALLMMSKKDLLALDFEGVLKHFRVALPKKYRQEENARLLLATAVSVKLKKLKRYAKDYTLMKEQLKIQEDPVEKLKKENDRYQASNMRLELENDDLANELITMKSQLTSELKVALDKVDSSNKDLTTAKKALDELEDEKKRLQTEVTQVKELCRRELQQAEGEISRNASIITEYKQICSQLNLRMEKEQHVLHEYANKIKTEISSCEHCSKLFLTANDILIPQPNNSNQFNYPDKSGEMDTDNQIRELELELAQTKLALVEAECKNQDLIHQLNNSLAELQASKNTWLHKTWSSLRDVTKKETGGTTDSKEGT